MSQHYLDFEEPIRRLDEKILELRSQTDPSQELLNEIANAQQKRYQLIEKGTLVKKVEFYGFQFIR